jgi:Mini-chromosome maintenance replisome factor
MVAEMTKAKDLFIHHLTQLFDGDDLAAQFVLLNLTTPLTHRNPIPVGHLPMNIYSTPSPTTKALTTFLQSVLPALSIQPFAIDLLNKTPLYPRSDGEKLFSGRGQYVSRTALVIDEAGLQEGKLGDTGVRNLRFLSRIPVAQKLGFEFPYHEFDIDTDLSFLVLGDSKSILPVKAPRYLD